MAGESILIVDDTVVNLKVTRIMLVNLGYRVLTASSAEEAVKVLQSSHPRLVLTDIQLPGMDGLELTRRIKSEAATADILVVALAAFATPGEEEEALRAGCDGCIRKPVEPGPLGLRVREFLARGQVPAPAEAAGLAGESDLRSLRDRFLQEAYAQARQWEIQLEGEFDAQSAARVAHQWIGAAGLLACPEISGRAHDLQAALSVRPTDSSEVREVLDGLLRALAARLAEQRLGT